MAAIIPSHPLNRQPQHWHQIDWGNPLTLGLTYAAVNGLEFVSRTPTGGVRGSISVAGIGERGDLSYRRVADVAEYTVIGHVYITAAPAANEYGGIVWGHYTGATDNTQCGLSFGPENTMSVYAVNRANGTGSTLLEVASSFPYSAVWAQTGVLAQTNASVYKNGVLVSSTIAKSGVASFAVDSRRIFQRFVLSSISEQKSSAWAYKFNRVLSAAEVRALSAEPYQIFKAPARILYFAAPSGGGATIAGGLESLTLSTFGATVGSARNISGALESLALTTSAARVSSDRAITASVEAISITTSPARIASDRAVSAATEQLTVTPATASVALVSGIAAATEALSVTANPATVALAASIAATLEAITVTGLTATVSTSSNTNISAALESITVTVNPATVSRNTALAAALESLTVTPHAASIAVGQIVAAALEGLTLTSYPAGIALNVSIAAQLEQLNLATFAAQVGLGTNVAALTEALTLTPHGATLTFAPSVGAATEHLTLTTFAAVVGATEAALLSPGLEFTIPLSRMGYTIPLSRVHFTIPQE